MLHTKFRRNRSTGSPLAKKIFEGFLPFIGVAVIWSCDPNAANKLLFPLPMEAPHKRWLLLAKRFWRKF